MAGSGEESSLMQSIAVGGTLFLFTILALPVIDRFERRTLMLVGSIGYILTLASAAQISIPMEQDLIRPQRHYFDKHSGFYRFTCVWSGRGNLGIYQRNIPE